MRSIEGTITQYTQGVDQIDTLDRTPAEVAAIHDEAARRQEVGERLSHVTSLYTQGKINAAELEWSLAAIGNRARGL